MSFLSTYFLDPICTGQGYNVFNTFAYGLILLCALYGILLLFRRFSISLVPATYLALMPFILLGPTVRVMVDAGFYQKLFIVSCLTLNTSPGIYLLAGIPALFCVLLARFLEKKGLAFNRSLFSMGLIYFLLVHFFQYPVGGVFFSFDLFALFQVLFLTLISCALFFLFARRYYPFFAQRLPFLLVSSHLFDASTTFTGIYFYGYVEQHVLPALLIGFFGPFAMYVLKLLVVPFVVKLASSAEDDEKRLLYFAVFILGVGPGLRNMLSIFLGV